MEHHQSDHEGPSRGTDRSRTELTARLTLAREIDWLKASLEEEKQHVAELEARLAAQPEPSQSYDARLAGLEAELEAAYAHLKQARREKEELLHRLEALTRRVAVEN